MDSFFSGFIIVFPDNSSFELDVEGRFLIEDGILKLEYYDKTTSLFNMVIRFWPLDPIRFMPDPTRGKTSLSLDTSNPRGRAPRNRGFFMR